LVLSGLHTHAAFAELFDDFVMGYGFADHSVWRINEREFGKISEKDLTVKDFSCPEALGRVARSYVKVTLKFG